MDNFHDNPFAKKYKETLAARHRAREAGKIEKEMPKALKRKKSLAKKLS